MPSVHSNTRNDAGAWHKEASERVQVGLCSEIKSTIWFLSSRFVPSAALKARWAGFTVCWSAPSADSVLLCLVHLNARDSVGSLINWPDQPFFCWTINIRQNILGVCIDLITNEDVASRLLVWSRRSCSGGSTDSRMLVKTACVLTVPSDALWSHSGLESSFIYIQSSITGTTSS